MLNPAFATRALQLILCASLAGLAQPSPGRSRHVAAPVVVREQQTVLVHGRPEVWRLEWHGPTTPYCPASDAYGATSCPCWGFAYGEAGDLWLVRLSRGKEIDRLNLTGLFGDTGLGAGGNAVIERWPVYDDDSGLLPQPAFEKAVMRRPVVRVMHFADYDHDGAATEFYLQTGALSCGPDAIYGVVVGVSTQNPKLHALGTASKPERPLYLPPFVWKALRQASRSPVHVLDCPCGDFHCAGLQTELLLRWSAAGIDGTQFRYECIWPLPGKRGRLVSRTPLAALGDS